MSTFSTGTTPFYPTTPANYTTYGNYTTENHPTTTAETLTSTTQVGETVPPDNIIINPHDNQWRDIKEPDTTGPSEEIADMIIDTNTYSNESSVIYDDGGFTYSGFMITRVMSFPCLAMILISSILLVYIILRHLRSLLYLYISVVFYAFTQVKFETKSFPFYTSKNILKLPSSSKILEC